MKTAQKHDNEEDGGSHQRWITGKKGFYAFVGLLVMVGLAYWGYREFRAFRKQRLTDNAQAFYEREDWRSAGMLLEQLVAEDPKNFEAQRLLAKILDTVSPYQGLHAWERLAEGEPAEPANLIGYAYAALRLRQNEKLVKILAELAEHAPRSTEYQRLLAACALAKGDRAGLQRSLTELVQRDPTDELAQLNLATLLIGAAVPGEVEAARATLQKIAVGKNWRIRATLALIKDAPVRWPESGVGRPPYARLTEVLRLTPAGAAGTSSLRLMSSRSDAGEDLALLIVHMQAQPGANPEDWATLAMWMSLIGQPREALIWLESFEGMQGLSPAVLAARATLAAKLEAWHKLEPILVQQAWGQITAEGVRLVFEARAQRAAGDEAKSDRAWAGALRESEYSLPSLRILYRLTQQWDWPDRRQQALWVMARRFPGYGLAWQRLLEQAFAARDSGQVVRIYAAWSQAFPDDVAVQAERVLLGLLIQPANRKLSAEAAALFQKEPENPGCRMVQALALWRDQRAGEALAVLAPIKLDPAKEPRLALVQGLVLAANHQPVEAERMFALVPTGRLLPEEEALIKAARAAR